MTEERAKRRLAAILAADVISYSRLMGADETGTLGRLKAARAGAVDPAVDSWGGRVVKTTGDGLLCEFPSAVDAVNCGIAMQTAMAARESELATDQRLRFRVGINIGDLIVEDDDIYGDGVNVAARLEAAAEPGGIAISGAVHEQVSGKVDGIFLYTGDQEFKNIVRPVSVWQWTATGAPENVAEAGRSAAMTEKPSIAVIPFENLSADAELEYMAIGLSEDIITLLARLPGFMVIARHSTMGYRDTGADVRAIGRELGVRYVVEGSIRPLGDRLRVTVQLIDAQTGNHLWAERYDHAAEDIARLQDEITIGIVACLQPHLSEAEISHARRSHRGSASAWMLCQQGGMALQRHGFNRHGFGESERLLREAIALDPEFATAHAALSLNLAIAHITGHVEDEQEAVTEAERALSLAPDDPEVLGYAGCAISDLGEHDRGIRILQRAVELNPSNAQAWAALGTAHLAKGEPAKAVEHLYYSQRISPRDPRWAVWGSILALALAAQKRIEEAINEARVACDRDPQLYTPWVVLAGILMLSGRRKEARTALAEARRRHPDLTSREITGLLGFRSPRLLAAFGEESGTL